MKHSFDVNMASEFGVEEAIIIDNLFFWINKNVANKKHRHEDRFWTYNTIEAFKELFPYMSYSQISRRINSLVEKGILLKGNFNQSSYDRTLWYAFSNIGISILQNNGYHFANMKNGVNENEDSIPDSKPDIKTNNKPVKEKQLSIFENSINLIKAMNLSIKAEEDLLIEWVNYKHHVHKEHYKTEAFATKYLKDIKEFGFVSVKEAMYLSIANEYKGYFPKKANIPQQQITTLTIKEKAPNSHI